MSAPLKDQIKQDMIAAMKEKRSADLAIIRLVTSEIKQQEVDTRQDLEDAAVISLLEKMIKQRKASIEQYQAGGREDLAEKEAVEIELIRTYLPEPMSQDEVDALIKATIEELGASSMQDMGKVIGQLKSKLQGRADMAEVSAAVKSLLA